MIAVDLEKYVYGAGSRSLIRPTEGTIVERLPPLTPTSGTSASLSASLADLPQVFRITARGVGLRSSTVVVLQSTYIKR